jgi:hypothetical protein
LSEAIPITTTAWVSPRLNPSVEAHLGAACRTVAPTVPGKHGCRDSVRDWFRRPRRTPRRHGQRRITANGYSPYVPAKEKAPHGGNAVHLRRDAVSLPGGNGIFHLGLWLGSRSLPHSGLNLVIAANNTCAGPKGNNPVALAWVFLRRTESARPSCFAPSGESLLSNATKGTKKACPAYGPDGAGLPSRIPPPRRPAPRVRPCSPSGLSRHPCRMTS